MRNTEKTSCLLRFFACNENLMLAGCAQLIDSFRNAVNRRRCTFERVYHALVKISRGIFAPYRRSYGLMVPLPFTKAVKCHKIERQDVPLGIYLVMSWTAGML